jgi:hypothetical protein
MQYVNIKRPRGKFVTVLDNDANQCTVSVVTNNTFDHAVSLVPLTPFKQNFEKDRKSIKRKLIRENL